MLYGMDRFNKEEFWNSLLRVRKVLGYLEYKTSSSHSDSQRIGTGESRDAGDDTESGDSCDDDGNFGDDD